MSVVEQACCHGGRRSYASAGLLFALCGAVGLVMGCGGNSDDKTVRGKGPQPGTPGDPGAAPGAAVAQASNQGGSAGYSHDGTPQVAPSAQTGYTYGGVTIAPQKALPLPGSQGYTAPTPDSAANGPTYTLPAGGERQVLTADLRTGGYENPLTYVASAQRSEAARDAANIKVEMDEDYWNQPAVRENVLNGYIKLPPGLHYGPDGKIVGAKPSKKRKFGNGDDPKDAPKAHQIVKPN